MSDITGSIHDRLVAPRRVQVLARLLAPLLPEGGSVLDVGCGDGTISQAIQRLRPDLRIEGIDVLLREGCRLPVRHYDGLNIPFPDRSFDAALLVDVLHHATEPARLLEEAARMASKCVVVKDHLADGLFAAPTLRFMDWVGNARHGVALPYNYWKRAEWEKEFARLGLASTFWKDSLRLYPAPASWLFDRGLHFVTRLDRNR